MAMIPPRRKPQVLVESDCLDLMLAHARNPATMRILEWSVKAVHNLSTYEPVQAKLCAKALYHLLQVRTCSTKFA